MKLYVDKLINVEFVETTYMIWSDGNHGKPLAMLNPVEFKRFMDECQRVYNLPINAPDQNTDSSTSDE